MTAHQDAPATAHAETDAPRTAASDRRRFLQSSLVAGSAAASLVGLAGSHVSMARAQGLHASAGARKHYHIPVSDQTVHWGYFSKLLAPVVEVESGDFVMGVRDGFFTESHIAGEIGEVVLGRAPGRGSAAGVTIFKSLGMAVEDVVAADLVLSRAVEQGAGAELTL